MRDEELIGAGGRTPELTHGPVVVITGASAGVGRAAAHAFARDGARIGLVARSREALEEARREVEERGGSACVLPADVANASEVERAAEHAERELGPIDVWVNNAMATIFAPFHEVTPEEFERATQVSYLGFVYGTMAALRRMRGRDRGTIVQVGSALAHRAIPLQSAYCGAKFAVRGFTDALRSELLHDRSRVKLTMVQLPALNTPQFDWCLSRLPRKPQPVPPIFQPEVAARAIVYAARTRPRELKVGAPAVAVIWGSKLVSASMDRYLAVTGYSDQQTEEDVGPDRPSNLWRPAEGFHRTRGSFTERARPRSGQLWATIHGLGWAGDLLSFVEQGTRILFRMAAGARRRPLAVTRRRSRACRAGPRGRSRRSPGGSSRA